MERVKVKKIGVEQEAGEEQKEVGGEKRERGKELGKKELGRKEEEEQESRRGMGWRRG